METSKNATRPKAYGVEGALEHTFPCSGSVRYKPSRERMWSSRVGEQNEKNNQKKERGTLDNSYPPAAWMPALAKACFYNRYRGGEQLQHEAALCAKEVFKGMVSNFTAVVDRQLIPFETCSLCPPSKKNSKRCVPLSHHVVLLGPL